MGHARDRTHTHVLVKELWRRELIEHLTVVNAIIIAFFSLALLELVKFLCDDGVHRLEHADEVLGLALENGVLSQRAKLHVASLGP